jgi:hypothetical protein
MKACYVLHKSYFTCIYAVLSHSHFWITHVYGPACPLSAITEAMCISCRNHKHILWAQWDLAPRRITLMNVQTRSSINTVIKLVINKQRHIFVNDVKISGGQSYISWRKVRLSTAWTDMPIGILNHSTKGEKLQAECRTFIFERI